MYMNITKDLPIHSHIQKTLPPCISMPISYLATLGKKTN